MGLDSLGFSLPWLFGNSSSQAAVSSSHGKRHRRKSSTTSSGTKGRNVRSRAEQIALNNAAKRSKDSE